MLHFLGQKRLFSYICRQIFGPLSPPLKTSQILNETVLFGNKILASHFFRRHLQHNLM